MPINFLGPQFYSTSSVGQDKKAQLLEANWEISKMAEAWQDRNTDPTPAEIQELRDLLCDLDGKGWTIRPNHGFKMVLETMKTTKETTDGSKIATDATEREKTSIRRVVDLSRKSSS